jgi:glycosyltransferase involved in cell wall biosynthesis
MIRYLSISLLHPKMVRGGGQQVAYELFQGAQNDPDVNAFFLAGTDPGLPNAHTPPGAVFTGIDGRTHESIMFSYGFDVPSHLQTSWFVIEKIREYFTVNEFDWIHFHHSLFVGLDIIDLIKQMQPNAKIFYTLHEYLPICLADGHLKKKYNNSVCYDPSPQSCFKCFPEKSVDYFFLRTQLFKQKFSQVDHFITPSEFACGRYLEWGIEPDRISVIPNGQQNLKTENSRTVKTERDDNSIRFAFFGQMIDNKGAHLLLEAGEILSKRKQLFSDDGDIGYLHNNEVDQIEIYMHFYGGNIEFASEEYRNKIESIVTAQKDSIGKFIFHGEYTHEQLPNIMDSVDCVVVPSTWFEVFGLVVSEAWMFGKPVIVADIGGLSERVTEGVNGYKFTPNDPYDLANKMLKFVRYNYLEGNTFDGISPPDDQYSFWLKHKRLFKQTE